MKKIVLLVAAIITIVLVNAQVGVNTDNPQGIFNVDGAEDNPSTGTPTTAQQGNDFVVTSDGSVGVGTTSPNTYAKLHVASGSQGILIPNISLTSNTMDLNSDGDNDVSNQPSGLLV